MIWLDEARARCEAATEGPWEWSDQFHACEHDGLASSSGLNVVRSAIDYGGSIVEVDEADARFIAHARTDLPRALDLIERMAGVLRDARENLTLFHDDDEGGSVNDEDGWEVRDRIDALLKEVSDAQG